MKERRDSAWKKAAVVWIEAKNAMDKAKAKIQQLAGEESCYGGGVKLVKSLQAGRVNYDAIPELKAVDLAPYRGPPSWRFKISESHVL